jgi:hypothetical protein
LRGYFSFLNFEDFEEYLGSTLLLLFFSSFFYFFLFFS